MFFYFFQCMLDFNQNRRISAQDALKYPYFHDFVSEHSVFESGSQNTSMSSNSSNDNIVDENEPPT